MLFQMFGGKQIKLSCLLTISVHSNPRKACDLINSLQEVFSSTFDTEEPSHPVCTRSGLLNQNQSEFVAEQQGKANESLTSGGILPLWFVMLPWATELGFTAGKLKR